MGAGGDGFSLQLPANAQLFHMGVLIVCVAVWFLKDQSHITSRMKSQ